MLLCRLPVGSHMLASSCATRPVHTWRRAVAPQLASGRSTSWLAAGPPPPCCSYEDAEVALQCGTKQRACTRHQAVARRVLE